MTYQRFWPLARHSQYAYFEASDDFTLKMTVTAGYTVYVDWGDNSSQQWVADGTEKTVAHNYASAGDYLVRVTGDIPGVTTIDMGSESNISVNIGGFSKLSSLTSLRLEATSTTGDVSAMAGLTSLTELYLHSTSVSGNISNFSSHTSLQHLRLGSTSVIGNISSLSGLTALVSLYLYSTSILGDIADIAPLTLLTNLRLYDTSLSGDIADINALTSLTKLYAHSSDVDYTTATLPAWSNNDIRIDSTELQSSSEVDQFLIDLAAAGGTNGTLNIAGDNAARTSASDAAKATLLANGWTVTVNE